VECFCRRFPVPKRRRLKWPEDEPIESKMVTRAVQNAQGQIEELNYERRKNVLKYDEVMNGQRTVIYGERHKILEGGDLKEEAQGFAREVVEATVATYCPPDVFDEEWDRDGLLTALSEVYPLSLTKEQVAEVTDAGELQELFAQDALRAYEEKEAEVGAEAMRELERVVLLNILDTRWREHLYEMDYLQEGIYLRSYAQKDPITEYRREAFDMFEELTATIRTEFVRYIYRVELVRPEQQQRRVAAPKVNRVKEGRGEGEETASAGGAQETNPNQVFSDKVPRNAPCPCGSGRKYKKCHGAVA
jgi:preprotein translocase subunit SecA